MRVAAVAGRVLAPAALRPAGLEDVEKVQDVEKVLTDRDRARCLASADG
jgi:hypothetical protein